MNPRTHQIKRNLLLQLQIDTGKMSGAEDVLYRQVEIGAIVRLSIPQHQGLTVIEKSLSSPSPIASFLR